MQTQVLSYRTAIVDTVFQYVINVGNLNVNVDKILEAEHSVRFDMINYIKNKYLDENVRWIADKPIQTTNISRDDMYVDVIMFSKKLFW
jgi:hypothetical protein